MPSNKGFKSNKKMKKKPAEAEIKLTPERKVGKVIQWFPGHMAKAKREIAEDLKYVDIAIELCDARIPVSSRNPQIKYVLNGKPSVLLMNKSSLADPEVNEKWKRYYEKEGQSVLFTDALTGKGTNEIVPEIRKVLAEKLERFQAKGMNRLPRAVIIGVTNAGKSTLVNKLYGSKKAKTEDRPGVTRQNQWITVKDSVDLLDTPGILWPKFDDEETGLSLAFTGAIRDEILDKEEIAIQLCDKLRKLYPQLLCERYKITEDIQELMPHELFELIGKKRGFLISGGEIDYARCAAMLLDEFRGGKIGRISLEFPPEETKKAEENNA